MTHKIIEPGQNKLPSRVTFLNPAAWLHVSGGCHLQSSPSVAEAFLRLALYCCHFTFSRRITPVLCRQRTEESIVKCSYRNNLFVGCSLPQEDCNNCWYPIGKIWYPITRLRYYDALIHDRHRSLAELKVSSQKATIAFSMLILAF